jgi:hypothetical protein
VRGVVRRLLHAGSHEGGRAEDAVEPRAVDHLDDRRHATALLAHEARPGTLQLDLGRGIRAVAELVFEPLDAEPVARAVGEDARQEEAAEPGPRLGEHEEGVAHRRGAEPLVAGQLVLAVEERSRDGRVLSDVRAALALRHRHPAERSGFLPRRSQAGVVVERRQARLPLGSEGRLGTQRRNGRVRHRDGAAVPRLHLRLEHEQHRAGDVGTGPRLAPGERVQTVRDRQPHQLVPRWVELDLIAPVAVTVVCTQDWRVLVRESAELERLRLTEQAAELPR